MFRTVLIANRGEIAVRIAAAARALGVRSVAVYSDADADSPHVAAADVAVRIGPAAARDSYLSIPALLDAARATGADAIHPGYGFLSENAQFAQACADAGITFIGPSHDAIALMGDKRAAKRAIEAAGVRGVPGYQGDDHSDLTLLAEAESLGVPLMVKAAAGGGGRGMRVVRDLADLPEAIRSARAESQSAFGSDVLLLERAVLDARHVEIQILADTHGTVLHLGERDCSVQRRHQKVVEEAPSPAVTPALREAMGAAAVAVAQSCDYVGAGTVEFLLEDDGSFWFLEMNTRLQVEHPVTEMVTGLDLVQLQLRVAAGEPLPFSQADVALTGHSIEVRIYAEDPIKASSQTGAIAAFVPPPGVRFDQAIGATVSSHYDPMLGKLIAHGPTRDVAAQRLAGALDQLVLLGVTTNRAWLARLLRHDDFLAGRATTSFLVKTDLAPPPVSLRDLAVIALIALRRSAPSIAGDRLGWSSGRPLAAVFDLERGDSAWALSVLRTSAGVFEVRHGEESVTVALLDDSAASGSVPATVTVAIDGVRRVVPYAVAGPTIYTPSLSVTDVTHRPAQSADGGTGTLTAPLDGAVTHVFVQDGATVAAGELLLVMEAMKMEHRFAADIDGTVTLAVRLGDQVRTRQLLATIAPMEAS